MKTPLIPRELIRKKRDNHSLTKEEIDSIALGIRDNIVSDEQIAALTMAIFHNGLNHVEQMYFTSALAHSGTILDWSSYNLRGPVVDKHSTGGVGDKASFLLAPMIAACGGFMPMIAGRGLGHTGGTIDKLESIPGFNVFLDFILINFPL